MVDFIQTHLDMLEDQADKDYLIEQERFRLVREQQALFCKPLTQEISNVVDLDDLQDFRIRTEAI